MKRYIIPLSLVLFFLAACGNSVSQATVTTPPYNTLSPTNSRQVETQTAASVFADQTSTAVANNATQASIIETQRSLYEASLTASNLTAAVRTPSSSDIYLDFPVPANACWVDSHIQILTGQEVTISVTGMINTNTGKQSISSGPDGAPSICDRTRCPIQGFTYGALIGRLDEAEPFVIGTDFKFTATKDGPLYFTVNDWDCKDNNGVFTLTITVYSPSKQ